MFSFRAIPLITVSVVIYNLMILLGGKDVFGAEAFHFPMVNGGRITFSWGDLLLAVTLILLFFEIIKSTYVSSVGQLEHILSVIVGVFCIVELLVSEKGQTSVFFLISLMAFVDIAAGYIIGVRVARKEMQINRDT